MQKTYQYLQPIGRKVNTYMPDIGIGILFIAFCVIVIIVLFQSAKPNWANAPSHDCEGQT